MASFVTSCNVEKFDLINHFQKDIEVYWKQISKATVGDEVYVYVGRPYSKVLFKCVITEKDVSDYTLNYLGNLKSNQKIMRIKLVKQIKVGLPLCDLIAHGLKTVQCATEASQELINYIEERIR